MRMFKRQAHVQEETDGETIDNLLFAAKRQVKMIMEEAATKKCINEDSSIVTMLCGSIEACLQYKLKKQSLGLFSHTSSTTALIHKIAKYLDVAKDTSKVVSEMESHTDHLRFSLKNLTLDGGKSSPTHQPNGTFKCLWIRVALFQKVLAKIVSYLVVHSSKYYESTSLMCDKTKGSVLAQLLEGPCALEYSRMKTLDHLFTDPNADELVLRHRLHSHTSLTSQSSVASSHKRPALAPGRSKGSGSTSSDESTRSVPIHAREYVDSLHQNHKAQLLYGKNNVKVLPRDADDLLPGYLSLHQTAASISLKWTPNQLINSNRLHTHIEEGSSNCTSPTTESSYPSGRLYNNTCRRSSSLSSSNVSTTTPVTSPISSPDTIVMCKDNSWGGGSHNRNHPLMWDCAINVNIDEIVYLHCHHQGSCGGTLILVGIDGVQSPAFHFPFGGHLLAFLNCLESGLQPHARLDPPLWIHKDTGKIFPKLKKKRLSLSTPKAASESGEFYTPSSSVEDELDIDYVFRIVGVYKPKAMHELIDPRRLSLLSFESIRSLRLPWSSSVPTDSPTHSSHASHTSNTGSYDPPTQSHIEQAKKPPLQTRDSLQRLCTTMKLQIVSRAFYGWLAHCRHLKTVREHLSGLVYNGEATLPTPPHNNKYLSTKFWKSLSDSDMVSRQCEIYSSIYYGGVSPQIRKQVWPYLLDHYKFGMSKEDKKKLDATSANLYEKTKFDWQSVESVLQQREALLKANIKAYGNLRPPHDLLPPTLDLPIPDNFRKRLIDRQVSNLSNEVFLDSVIVAEINANNVSGTVKPPPPLTKWHTVDSNYHEDFCAVKVSSRNPLRSSSADAVDGKLDPNYNEKILEEVKLNLHRIDKDVHRCDRNYWYFTENNLKKLRNVMCTYVWKNLDVGYIQGMCDLVAPLLVIFDDESLTYSCFCNLMKKMVENFPGGTAMDNHLANMRSLVMVLDPELYDLLHLNGDYTHFFFCYRWLLLDFKREMCYEDVFLVWESIWAAKHVCSDNYVAFIGLAMMEAYRDILIDNAMEMVEIIKFFNEMAEKHNAREVLSIARDLVFRLQTLIENK